MSRNHRAKRNYFPGEKKEKEIQVRGGARKPWIPGFNKTGIREVILTVWKTKSKEDLNVRTDEQIASRRKN